jgi:hypothetical protein
LSNDNVPALFDLFHVANLSPSLKDGLGEILVCRDGMEPLATQKQGPWQSFNASVNQAGQLYQKYAGELKAYKLVASDAGWDVKVKDTKIPCTTSDQSN